MTQQLLVAGGGIGGLAAAVAAARAGWSARVFEQAPAFSEVGAGIQMGPNVTQWLRLWGVLEGELSALVCQPAGLIARRADTGAAVGWMRLGRDFESRYGAPYLTVHRADLHSALWRVADAQGVRVWSGTRIKGYAETEQGGQLMMHDGRVAQGDALVGADGLWSTVRQQLLGDGRARPTGHLAYRALVRQADLPATLRLDDVTLWLGPRMHMVAYPVRGGQDLNLVCVVHGTLEGDPTDWDHAGVQAELLATLGPQSSHARRWIEAVPQWRRWVLHGRAPVAGPQDMVRGRVALLGDAAHPMKPYLAQGAGMAIEDAAELGRVLGWVRQSPAGVPGALARYGLLRWKRCAQVQRRSDRNGFIFHATGALRFGRDLSMRVLGERLLDQRWLYGGGPLPF